ncbi:hypothetical protein CAPTEDRAFT_214758 [Capitella teleta]|uniref:HAT C-terminal dimerisation domain-containing protein n=1 Tax=Capitella teleta TaxID=283909 RepID=R7UJ66_CAPTE|nr:hypothetical protein CAPTEDRAFT_214758 [Capitella teleta]|eukprot:ELU03327.1 hypothetical protein CAPTEDRAFT_214758 [Capitella teleta]
MCLSQGKGNKHLSTTSLITHAKKAHPKEWEEATGQCSIESDEILSDASPAKTPSKIQESVLHTGGDKGGQGRSCQYDPECDTHTLFHEQAKEQHTNEPTGCWGAMDQFTDQSQEEQSGYKSPFKIEIDTYTKEALIDCQVDPIEWWQGAPSHYPLLATHARKFLFAPPSSVKSERNFLTCGNIVTEKIFRLNVENVEILVVLNENIASYEEFTMTSKEDSIKKEPCLPILILID